MIVLIGSWRLWEKHLIEEEILEPRSGEKLTSFRDSESAQQKYVQLMEDIPSLDEESASKVKMAYNRQQISIGRL
ncbi:MAG: hypothetical protein CM1200mP41_08070 [Gammaproteobacteria bacterium]|nr:MAG: hypothetical protein CM1200mP41_08070 [Gammaproteobacteria bacterium]